MKNGLKKAIAALVAGTVVAGILTGCGGSGNEKEKANAETKKSEKAEVSIAMSSDPDGLDASRAEDTQKNAIILEVQETLIRFDENGEAQPAGAESWESTEDGLTWTFHLRDNKYSDGSDVKAEDYVNCLVRTVDPEVGSRQASIWYMIKGAEAYNTGTGEREDVGVKAVDEKTLEVTLAEPIPYFINMVNSASFTPIPASRTEGADNTTYGSDASKMVYSGPFMIEDWTRGKGVTMKKNPNYWDAESVKLDTVNMMLVEEENTRQQLFEQGQIDALENVQAEYFEKSKAKIDAKEIQLVEIEKPSVLYISFNNQDPEGIFTNAKIRKAFSLAIDRETYIEKIRRKDEPAYGIIPPVLSNGESNYRDNVEEPLLAVKDEDPKKLMEEGLKEIGKEGEEITVTFLQGDANNQTKVSSEFFQDQWEKKLGVKVKIDTAADFSSFNNQVAEGMYQICNSGWGADYDDPMTFMQIFEDGDSNNGAKASNAKYSELVEACKLELDIKVREEKFTEAEKIIVAEDASVAPLSYGLANNFFSGRLKGASFNGAGGPAIELKTAYVEE